jgi:hypothetical protein
VTVEGYLVYNPFHCSIRGRESKVFLVTLNLVFETLGTSAESKQHSQKAWAGVSAEYVSLSSAAPPALACIFIMRKKQKALEFLLEKCNWWKQ